MRKLCLFLVAVLFVLGAWAQVRTGAWVDEVVFTEEPSSAKGVDMVRTGAIDLYAYAIADPSLIKTIVAELGYEVSYGSYNEFSFNPYGPEFTDGRLNPFAVPAIREAVNWLIDRDYIVAEFFGGVGAVPRYFAITPSFPDYARLADVARALELKYAPNPEKAKSIIFAEMEKLGAEFKDGKWYYKGAPVVLKFLIRPEDERKQCGDYLATLFEGLGFEVERMYKRAAEASPIWLSGDPSKGEWHVYTGGWVTTIVDRDQADNFDYFYTPRGRPDTLWRAYKPDPEFDAVAERLGRAAYSTMEERRELLSKALELSMKDSVRIFYANRVGYTPRAKNIKVAADLAGAVYGAWLWSRTIRFEDQVGGTVRIAQPSMLTEPWNAVAGTNWVYDLMIIRGVSDYAAMTDPYTGLYYPQLLEKADIYVVEGAPIGKTLDWVELHFVPEIKVPEDAWYDWDAAAQRFVTVGEAKPEGLTARGRTVLYFPADLYERQWHDGSKFSIADGLLRFILLFDRAKPESPIYDEAAVAAFQTFRAHFKGLKILSVNPLVFEVYSDYVDIDAETQAAGFAGYLMPQYAQGTAPWHTIALGIKAEAEKKLTFSSAKSKKIGVDWMNYLAGPSLEILTKYLEESLATGYIPYTSVLGNYLTSEEAIARYQNLKAWFAAHGHLWVGMGPLYVDLVKPVEKVVVLKRFEAFPDLAEKWARFAEPWIAAVEVSSPAPVLKLGAPWDFLVDITFKDQPYPVKDIDFVTYLLFDAEGNLVLSGRAEPVQDGLFVVTVPASATKNLPVGSIRIEVAVASKLVAIPSFASATFTAIP